MEETNNLAVPEREPLHPGERTNFEGKAVVNSLLLSITDEPYAALREDLIHQELPQYTVLQEPKQRVEYVHFLNAGMASLVCKTQDGDSVEVGVVGNEGFTPLQVSAGLRSTPHQAIMQIAGSGFRLDLGVLEDAMRNFPELLAVLNRYAAIHGLQVAQTAGCNRLHSLEQRLARWLLLTQDRVGSGMLRITHDFLATMLGTDRPSVSLAAAGLQKKEIIEYSHGTVQILNRKKLESSACECYGVVRQFSGEMATK